MSEKHFNWCEDTTNTNYNADINNQPTNQPYMLDILISEIQKFQKWWE
jgi:hypothetical protein